MEQRDQAYPDWACAKTMMQSFMLTVQQAGHSHVPGRKSSSQQSRSSADIQCMACARATAHESKFELKLQSGLHQM